MISFKEFRDFQEAKKSLNKKPLAKGKKEKKLNVAGKVDSETGDGSPDFKVKKGDENEVVKK